jgi:hypothetical protein
MNSVLLTTVRDFVERCKKEHHLLQWHFLRERCPPTFRIPEIRLRLNAPEDDIPHIRNDAERLLSVVSDPELHIGAHEKAGEEYAGEVETFGERGWPIFARFLHDCSEIALEFLEKEPEAESEKSREHYIERSVHLMLNQIFDVQTYVGSINSYGSLPLGAYPYTKWLLVPMR